MIMEAPDLRFRFLLTLHCGQKYAQLFNSWESIFRQEEEVRSPAFLISDSLMTHLIAGERSLNPRLKPVTNNF